ncbi:MAG: hypothetical protein CMQ27_09980 [Gammaproteobacteria bacterium]|nr:hypothetical protein [Gammaproteobacteria bacterium]
MRSLILSLFFKSNDLKFIFFSRKNKYDLYMYFFFVVYFGVMNQRTNSVFGFKKNRKFHQ